METVLPEYAGLVKSSHRAATEALEPSIQTDALSSRVSAIITVFDEPSQTSLNPVFDPGNITPSAGIAPDRPTTVLAPIAT